MNLVLGLGLSSAATVTDVWSLTDLALAEVGCERHDIVRIATIDTRTAHPTVRALSAAVDCPIVAFSAAVLDAQGVAHRSTALLTRIGTASVAEAAALLAAGGGALLVERRANSRAVIAIAAAATVEPAP